MCLIMNDAVLYNPKRFAYNWIGNDEREGDEWTLGLDHGALEEVGTNIKLYAVSETFKWNKVKSELWLNLTVNLTENRNRVKIKL